MGTGPVNGRVKSWSQTGLIPIIPWPLHCIFHWFHYPHHLWVPEGKALKEVLLDASSLGQSLVSLWHHFSLTLPYPPLACANKIWKIEGKKQSGTPLKTTNGNICTCDTNTKMRHQLQVATSKPNTKSAFKENVNLTMNPTPATTPIASKISRISASQHSSLGSNMQPPLLVPPALTTHIAM